MLEGYTVSRDGNSGEKVPGLKAGRTIRLLVRRKPGVPAPAQGLPEPGDIPISPPQSLPLAPEPEIEPGYRLLMEGLYDAVIITRLDGTIIDANGRALNFFQYEKEEMLGHNVSEIFAGFSPNLLDRVKNHIAEGRFTILDAYGIRRDGLSFATETVIGSIQLSPEGELVVSVRNVERRRQSQEQLRTEHNALHNSASCVAITDTSGTIRYVNPAFLKLWKYESVDDVLDKDIRLFWERRAEAAVLVAVPMNSTTWAGELSAKASDGTIFLVHGTAAPNRSTQDQIIGVVCSFVDITEQKRAQEIIRKEAAAQLKEARNQQAFHGMLNVISLMDVIQLIHATRKTGTLQIRSSTGGALGVAAFRNGSIIHADCGVDKGESAVHALLTCPGEAFTFDPKVTMEMDPTIKRSVMSLILESAQRMDESPQ